MTSISPPGAIDVLRAARESVAAQMRAFESSGQNWQEESVTSQFLASCHPTVLFATFTHTEEADTGGDWLWWWIDDSGEAFGMLVQAKRLRRPWSIEFDYKRGEQRRRLFETADELDVPPIYALYLGTAAFREGVFCRAKPPRTCDYCDAAAVSMVPAILTSAGGGSARDQVTSAVSSSIPVEWLADPSRPVLGWDPNFRILDPELQAWIISPQIGARGIARRVFDRVTRVRAGQFTDGRSTLAAQRGDHKAFASLPQDHGHFGVPIHEHVLRGLRREAPDYVLDVIAGMRPPTPPVDGVAGVAVFKC